MPIRCFFLEPTDVIVRSLRRCSRPAVGNCRATNRQHMGEEVIDAITWPAGKAFESPRVSTSDRSREDWPICCDAEGCDYVFDDGRDLYEIHDERLFRRTDSNKTTLLTPAPLGAMWYADGLPREAGIPNDGRRLVIQTPGGQAVVAFHHLAQPTVQVDAANWHGFLRKMELIEGRAADA